MSFNNPRNFNVQGNVQNIVYGDQVNQTARTTNYVGNLDTSFQNLAEKVAVNALHSSEQRAPPPNCLPCTRTEPLNTLSQWIEGNARRARVCWLYGSAGVGKSAIAQNLSEKYAGSRFVRCYTTDCLKDLIGTTIIETIHNNPNIFHSSLENQFHGLIQEPASKTDVSKRENHPWLIVIDGLDECVDILSQERLVAVIRKAATSLTFSVPFIFLFCSRPEPRIRYAFDHGAFKSVLRRIAIGASPDSDRDIELFLRTIFTRLREKHAHSLRHTGKDWPGDDVVRRLVHRASGQFIFVATVLKYLDCEDDVPSERLNTIMRGSASNIPNSPYPDLDQLYNQLLSRCSDWQATFRILQILITPHKNKSATTAERIAWRSSRVIEGILKLKPGQLGIHLVHLHSVLYIPEDEDSDIHIFHASFTEFLTEHSRSGLYHVEPLQSNQYWDLFAQFLLHMQSLLPFPPYSSKSGLSQLIVFSCLYWHRFCCSENPSHDLVDMLDTFDPYPVFTAILHRQVPIKSFFVKWRYTEWEQCLAWAKSLGPRTPRKFVQVLESFYHGFSIVLPPGSSPYWAYVSSLLELHLSFESHRPRNYFYDELYLKKMSASHSDTVDVYLKPFPFIIPASRLPVIPQDWGKVDITGTEAKEFHTLMNRFVPRNDSETTQRLVQDVLNNTQNTTSTDSNRRNELERLKRIVLKHWQVFKPVR